MDVLSWPLSKPALTGADDGDEWDIAHGTLDFQDLPVPYPLMVGLDGGGGGGHSLPVTPSTNIPTKEGSLHADSCFALYSRSFCRRGDSLLARADGGEADRRDSHGHACRPGGLGQGFRPVCHRGQAAHGAWLCARPPGKRHVWG